MAYTIGESYGGGIIFYIDGTGEHGFIAAPADLGKFNWDDAIAACAGSDLGGFKDWFLPDDQQLNALFIEKDIIGGFNGLVYWSSSENDGYGWGQFFFDGLQVGYAKDFSNYVRAVRAF